MAKQNVWTVLAENAVSKKPVNYNITEMNDTEAALAISEAMYEAGVAVHAGNDINDAILEFAMKADARGYDAMDYIVEAFNFGGFFKKIYDFLIKMWGTIVNYFKALIGNKFGSSGNIMKNISKINENLAILNEKTYDPDAEVKLKQSGKLIDAANFAALLASPALYLETPLLDSTTNVSAFWGESGSGDTVANGRNLNILTITRAAVSLSNTVQAMKNEKTAGNTRQETNTDLGVRKTSIEGAVSDLKSFNGKLSLGEKGAVESFSLLIDKSKEENNVKKIVDDAKLKDSKNLTELLRKLLTYFFPPEGGIDTLTGGNIKTREEQLRTAIGRLLRGGAKATADTTATVRSDEAMQRLIDPIKAATKHCEDILSQLKQAATIIQGVSKGDIEGTQDRTTTTAGVNSTTQVRSDDQGTANGYVDKLNEFGKELTTTSTNMQQVVLKGMDAASVLFETCTKEILAQTEVLMKAPADRVQKATATAR